MFDRDLERVYVACSSGAISVFQMDDPTHFRKLQDFPVEPKIQALRSTRRPTGCTRRRNKKKAGP